MKQILTVVIIQICLTAFGQIDIKEVDKSLAKINETLYASKYEVSNKLYMNFINLLKKTDQKDKLKIAQIDSSKWNDKFSSNEPYVAYYHSHAAYQNYPVVNITYEAAVMFCDWLTNEYNANPNRKFIKVLFRLPTEQEWIIAAKGGDTSTIYPWKGTELMDKKGYYLCNCVRTITALTDVVGDITAPVASYKPNGFGLYNMSGNVAEMITGRNIVKGGSWYDREEFMKISSKQDYDGSAKRTVGFRYFVDIIEK